MITQIEIDGFKTFRDFKVELAPFQVIVGPNASGKSNLFDALQLLSRLVSVDLLSAFKGLRGDVHELFTNLPGEKSNPRIHIAVEMLIDSNIQDEFGNEVQLTHRRLRYEITISLKKRGTQEQLRVIHESLASISIDKDEWSKKYTPILLKEVYPETLQNQSIFIETSQEKTNKTEPLLLLNSENEHEGKIFFSERMKRTILSGVNNIDFPHTYAVSEALRSLNLLHLNPKELRRPSQFADSPYLSQDGENLPATLARIQNEDPLTFNLISLDMARLVPGILAITVEKDQIRNQYYIQVKMSDQRTFSANVLSDGTLHLLALATLRNDPQLHGTVCIEEPENGVQSLYLPRVAELLRSMATNFGDSEQANQPLKQILVITHSPLFISLPEVRDSLLLTIMPSYVEGKGLPPLQITRMVPVVTRDTSIAKSNDRNRAIEAYTIDTVKKILNEATLQEARDYLQNATGNL